MEWGDITIIERIYAFIIDIKRFFARPFLTFFKDDIRLLRASWELQATNRHHIFNYESFEYGCYSYYDGYEDLDANLNMLKDKFDFNSKVADIFHFGSDEKTAMIYGNLLLFLSVFALSMIVLTLIDIYKTRKRNKRKIKELMNDDIEYESENEEQQN